MTATDIEAVRFWIERLRLGTESEKLHAASEITRLRIRTRGVLHSRGDLNQSAPNDFPPEVRERAMDVVLNELQSASAAIRTEVAVAVGQWADESAVVILTRMLTGPGKDIEEQVRRACVAALSLIGGPGSAEALRLAALKDESDAVRGEAIDALAGLAVSSYPPKHPVTRPTIRTRGLSSHGRSDLTPQATEVLRTLQKIVSDDAEQEYIRQLAKRAADPLQD